VTEFCTSIKPFGFEYFFTKGYEFVAYFDPDIFFYDKFYELYNDKDTLVLLTPHILKIKLANNDESIEENFLKHGIYNCGFIAFKNGELTKLFIAWWKDKSIDKFYMDSSIGIYTDQRWIDFVPAFFKTKQIHVVRNMGCNLAPWNYFERKIVNSDEHYFVVNRELTDLKLNEPLCFIHFSGYKYKYLLNGDIVSIYKYKYEDIIPLIKKYGKELNISRAGYYLDVEYKYNRYNNGIIINKFHRRLFRKLVENKLRFDDPFSCGSGTFYELLYRSRMIDKSSEEFVIKENIPNISLKNKMAKLVFIILYHMLGIRKYIYFLRSLPFYSVFENHVFLLKKN